MGGKQVFDRQVARLCALGALLGPACAPRPGPPPAARPSSAVTTPLASPPATPPASSEPSAAPAPEGRSPAPAPPAAACPEGTAFFAGGPFRRIASDYGQPWPAYDPKGRPEVTSVGPFCLDKTEVTVAAYRACLRAGACSPLRLPLGWAATQEISGRHDRFCNALDRADRARHPVNCVDWWQAAAYCRWAGGQLPSSNEWLYAAQGGPLARRYPWGDGPTAFGLLNICGTECTARRRIPSLDDTFVLIEPAYPKSDGWKATAPVGSFPRGATPEGVHDLRGNVEEWTRTEHLFRETRLEDAYYQKEGGHWLQTGSLDNDHGTTASGWGYGPVSERTSLLGFRCAKSLAPPGSPP